MREATMRKIQQIKCESCNRSMKPGEKYWMIKGKIVCEKSDCMVKALERKEKV
jgi:hypothetical protein